MRIAIATCVQLPEPDADQELLLDTLRARGTDARMAAWDDESVDWSSFDRCVIRSTWNYHHARDRFVAWAERVASITELRNSAAIVRWNTHKKYLHDLERGGVPIVPTHWIDRGSEESLDSAMRALGADEVVVKPAVSAASFGTRRLGREGEAHLRELARERDVMVQPYVRSVEGYGERSIIFVAGAFTHAIRKSPRFGGEHESVSPALPIAEDEREIAERALAHVPEKLLYARVDLARDADGEPMIMELELVEPSLFLAQSPAALARLADAIAS